LNGKPRAFARDLALGRDVHDRRRDLLRQRGEAVRRLRGLRGIEEQDGEATGGEGRERATGAAAGPCCRLAIPSGDNSRKR
jgi:hypothetical protein